MFVIQRCSRRRALTILDQNKVLLPSSFHPPPPTPSARRRQRLYHGTQQLNRAARPLEHRRPARLPPEQEEVDVVLPRCRRWPTAAARSCCRWCARPSRRASASGGDVSTLMSPRTVISWADNFRLFRDLDYAFETAFLNRCDEAERPVVAEYYQRATAARWMSTPGARGSGSTDRAPRDPGRIGMGSMVDRLGNRHPLSGSWSRSARTGGGPETDANRICRRRCPTVLCGRTA